MPATDAADPGATSDAVTPSARALHSTPSSTSCHREYIVTFAMPSATSTATTTIARTDRVHTSHRASIGSLWEDEESIIGGCWPPRSKNLGRPPREQTPVLFTGAVRLLLR